MEKTDNRYLVFDIANEQYGIPINKVREVIRYEKITPVREAQVFLKGVINLRGKIIPIIDMRLKFGIEEITYTDRTVFIIVDVLGGKDMYNLGIAVDSVHDVVTLPETQIEKTPEVGLKLKSNYLLGIAKQNDIMLMIINIDRILSNEEIMEIQSEKTL